VIRRKLKILKNIQFLTLQTTHQYSIATVLNYDKYNPIKNDDDPPNDQEAAQRRPTDDPQTTTDNKDKEYKKLKKTYTADFLKFWDSYPRKVGKAKAFQAWQKANGKPDLDNMLSILGRHKMLEQWQKESGQFIPHPASWINGRRWEDEIECQYPQTGFKTTEQEAEEKWLRTINKK
jgi:hypothetical protein